MGRKEKSSNFERSSHLVGLMSQGGFGMIEALIGAAILGIVSVSVVYLVVGSQGTGTTKTPAANEACRVVANRTLDIIREKGSALTYSNFLKSSPLTCNPTNCITETTTTNITGAYAGERWKKSILVPGAPPTPWGVNTDLLVVGYMNFLNTAVSKTPGVCSSPTGAIGSQNASNFLVDSMTQFITDDSNLRNTTKIATFIETYKLSSGSPGTNCSISGYRIAPRQGPFPSTFPDTPAFIASQKLFSDSEYNKATRDEGYLVTVKVTMRQPGETTDRTCTASQKFAYDNGLQIKSGKLTITTINSSLVATATGTLPNVSPFNYKATSGAMGASDIGKFGAGSPAAIPGPGVVVGTGSVTAIIQTARSDSTLLCRDRSRARLPSLATPPLPSIPNGVDFSNVAMVNLLPTATGNAYKRVIKSYSTPPVSGSPSNPKVYCLPGLCSHMPPFNPTGGPSNVWDIYNGGPATVKPVLPENTPTDYDVSTLGADTASWMPCQNIVDDYNGGVNGRLTTCKENGTLPATLGIASTAGQPDRMKLFFPYLREGCDVAIDVVEVGSDYSPTPIDSTFGYDTINEYILERNTFLCFTEAAGGAVAGVTVTPKSYFFSDKGCGVSPLFKPYNWHN